MHYIEFNTMHRFAVHLFHEYAHYITNMYKYIALHKYVRRYIYTHADEEINASYRYLPIYLTYPVAYLHTTYKHIHMQSEGPDTPSISFTTNKQWLKLFPEGRKDKRDGGGLMVVKLGM